jgi:hypothetical protein
MGERDSGRDLTTKEGRVVLAREAGAGVWTFQIASPPALCRWNGDFSLQLHLPEVGAPAGFIPAERGIAHCEARPERWAGIKGFESRSEQSCDPPGQPGGAHPEVAGL